MNSFKIQYISDNGLEFKNKLMAEEIDNWIGDCELRYGRPRHPQSQDLVEQSNGTITTMLASMRASSERPSKFKWSDHLPKVMFNMNIDRLVKRDDLTFDSYDRIVSRVGNDEDSLNYIDNDEMEVDIVESIVESEIVTSETQERVRINEQVSWNKQRNAEMMIRQTNLYFQL